MQKTVKTGKKVLSVVLSVLMIMSAWVFVAPTAVKAADAERPYTVKIYVKIFDGAKDPYDYPYEDTLITDPNNEYYGKPANHAWITDRTSTVNTAGITVYYDVDGVRKYKAIDLTDEILAFGTDDLYTDMTNLTAAEWPYDGKDKNGNKINFAEHVFTLNLESMPTEVFWLNDFNAAFFLEAAGFGIYKITLDANGTEKSLWEGLSGSQSDFRCYYASITPSGIRTPWDTYDDDVDEDYRKFVRSKPGAWTDYVTAGSYSAYPINTYMNGGVSVSFANSADVYYTTLSDPFLDANSTDSYYMNIINHSFETATVTIPGGTDTLVGYTGSFELPTEAVRSFEVKKSAAGTTDGGTIDLSVNYTYPNVYADDGSSLALFTQPAYIGKWYSGDDKPANNAFTVKGTEMIWIDHQFEADQGIIELTSVSGNNTLNATGNYNYWIDVSDYTKVTTWQGVGFRLRTDRTLLNGNDNRLGLNDYGEGQISISSSNSDASIRIMNVITDLDDQTPTGSPTGTATNGNPYNPDFDCGSNETEGSIYAKDYPYYFTFQGNVIRPTAQQNTADTISITGMAWDDPNWAVLQDSDEMGYFSSTISVYAYDKMPILDIFKNLGSNWAPMSARYDADLFEEYRAALENAMAVLANQKVKQLEIYNAATRLQNAVDALSANSALVNQVADVTYSLYEAAVDSDVIESSPAEGEASKYVLLPLSTTEEGYALVLPENEIFETKLEEQIGDSGRIAKDSDFKIKYKADDTDIDEINYNYWSVSFANSNADIGIVDVNDAIDKIDAELGKDGDPDTYTDAYKASLNDAKAALEALDQTAGTDSPLTQAEIQTAIENANAVLNHAHDYDLDNNGADEYNYQPPVQDATTGEWSQAVTTKTCNICGKKDIVYTDRADYDTYDDYKDKLNALIKSNTLTTADLEIAVNAVNDNFAQNKDANAQADVDAAANALKNAYESLVDIDDEGNATVKPELAKPDYSVAEANLATAKNLLTTTARVKDEVAAEITALETELEAVKTKTPEATAAADQAQVDRIAQDLQAIIDGLTDKSLCDPDYTAANDAVTNAYANQGLLDDEADKANVDELAAELQTIKDMADPEANERDNQARVNEIASEINTIVAEHAACEDGHTWGTPVLTTKPEVDGSTQGEYTQTCIYCGEANPVPIKVDRADYSRIDTAVEALGALKENNDLTEGSMNAIDAAIAKADALDKQYVEDIQYNGQTIQGGQEIINALADELEGVVTAINVGIADGSATNTYEVKFINYDGSIADTVYVKKGEAATSSATPKEKPSNDTYRYIAKQLVKENVTTDVDVPVEFDEYEHVYGAYEVEPRPVQDKTTGQWSTGVLIEYCTNTDPTECFHSKKTPISRANTEYAAAETAYKAVKALDEKNDLRDEVMAELNAALWAYEALATDLVAIPSEQKQITDVTDALNAIIVKYPTDENGKLTDKSALNPDFTAYDTIKGEYDALLENGADVLDSIETEVSDEISPAVEAVRDNTAATMEEQYQGVIDSNTTRLTEIVAGIKDGSLVKPDYTEYQNQLDAYNTLIEAGKVPSEGSKIIVQNAISSVGALDEATANQLNDQATVTTAADAIRKVVEALGAPVDTTNIDTKLANLADKEKYPDISEAMQAEIDKIKQELKEITDDPASNKDRDQAAVNALESRVNDIISDLNACADSGHDWEEGTTEAPTCTEKGYTNYVCSRCGKTKKDDFVDANGHKWSYDGYEASKPVENEDGTVIVGAYSFKCDNCDVTATVDAPKANYTPATDAIAAIEKDMGELNLTAAAMDKINEAIAKLSGEGEGALDRNLPDDVVYDGVDTNLNNNEYISQYAKDIFDGLVAELGDGNGVKDEYVVVDDEVIAALESLLDDYNNALAASKPADAIDSVDERVAEIAALIEKIKVDDEPTMAEYYNSIEEAGTDLESYIKDNGEEADTINEQYLVPDDSAVRELINNALENDAVSEGDKALINAELAKLDNIMENYPDGTKGDDYVSTKATEQTNVDDIGTAVEEILKHYSDCANGNHAWTENVTFAWDADGNAVATRPCGYCTEVQAAKSVTLGEGVEEPKATCKDEGLMTYDNVTAVFKGKDGDVTFTGKLTKITPKTENHTWGNNGYKADSTVEGKVGYFEYECSVCGKTEKVYAEKSDKYDDLADEKAKLEELLNENLTPEAEAALQDALGKLNGESENEGNLDQNLPGEVTGKDGNKTDNGSADTIKAAETAAQNVIDAYTNEDGTIIDSALKKLDTAAYEEAKAAYEALTTPGNDPYKEPSETTANAIAALIAETDTFIAENLYETTEENQTVVDDAAQAIRDAMAIINTSINTTALQNQLDEIKPGEGETVSEGTQAAIDALQDRIDALDDSEDNMDKDGKEVDAIVSEIATIKENLEKCANDEHAWVKGTTVEPTCTTGGYTPYTCSVCGETEKRDQVGANGHDWDTPVLNPAPTADATGIYTFTCKIDTCGATETVEVPRADYKPAEDAIAELEKILADNDSALTEDAKKVIEDAIDKLDGTTSTEDGGLDQGLPGSVAADDKKGTPAVDNRANDTAIATAAKDILDGVKDALGVDEDGNVTDEDMLKADPKAIVDILAKYDAAKEAAKTDVLDSVNTKVEGEKAEVDVTDSGIRDLVLKINKDTNATVAYYADEIAAAVAQIKEYLDENDAIKAQYLKPDYSEANANLAEVKELLADESIVKPEIDGKSAAEAVAELETALTAVKNNEAFGGAESSATDIHQYYVDTIADNLQDIIDAINDYNSEPNYKEAEDTIKAASDLAGKTDNVKPSVIEQLEELAAELEAIKTKEPAAIKGEDQAAIDDIRDAAQAIIDGINDKSLIDPDYSAIEEDLDKVVGEDGTFKNDEINGATKEAINDIIEELEDLKNDPSINVDDQDKVDALEDELEAIITGIENGSNVEPDYSEYKAAIAEYDALIAGGTVVSEGSSENVENHRTAVETLKKDPTANAKEDQKTVTDAANYINAVIADLKAKPDYGALQEKINEANSKDQDKLTQELKDAVDEVEAALEAIMNDPTTNKDNSQGKVNDLAEDMDAILEEIKALLTAAENCAAGKHVYGDWSEDKAPTCTEKGSKSRTCKYCGHVDTQEIGLIAHNFDGVEWVVVTKPGCETEGSRAHACKVCGIVVTESIKATGHDDADGNGKCDFCDADYWRPDGCVCHKDNIFSRIIRYICTLLTKIFGRRITCCPDMEYYGFDIGSLS